MELAVNSLSEHRLKLGDREAKEEVLALFGSTEESSWVIQGVGTH
jgi:hypothetical protein